VSTGQLTAPGARIYNPDRDDVAPRLGVTYDLRGNGQTILRAGYGYYSLYPPVSAEELLTANAPGATLLTRTQDPNLRYPVASLAAGASNPPTLGATDPNREDNYTRQATVNLQQQLGASTAVTIAYVGAWSRKNERTRPLNLIDPATNQRSNPQFSQILLAESSGRATYHALQSSLDRRFSDGLSFTANYTYSRLMDDIVSPQNPSASWDVEWARGAQEVPHNLSVNGVVLARSGLPYSVNLGAVTRSGTGWTMNQRPDVVSGVDHRGAIDGPRGWLNPAAFANPAVGAFGNLGRNTERGPTFVQSTVRSSKTCRWLPTRRCSCGLRSSTLSTGSNCRRRRTRTSRTRHLRPVLQHLRPNGRIRDVGADPVRPAVHLLSAGSSGRTDRGESHLRIVRLRTTMPGSLRCGSSPLWSGPTHEDVTLSRQPSWRWGSSCCAVVPPPR
jgi:hypothetical protein